MIKFFPRITILFLLIQTLIQAQSTTQPIDGVAAVVGKSIITVSDIEIAALQNFDEQEGNDKNKDLKCRVFEDLLFRKLLLAQAFKDSTLKVTDAEVEGEMDKRMRYYIMQLGSEEKFIQFYGKSVEDFKSELRDDIYEQMLSQRLQGKIINGVTISPVEVRNYFNRVPKDSLPYINSEVEIGEIVRKAPVSNDAKLIARERAESLRKKALAGEDFCSLALFSEDPGSAKNCGTYTNIARGTFLPEFDAIAFQLKEKEISEVFETTYGFHFMQLIRRKGEYVDLRHILIAPKTSTNDMIKAKASMDSIVNYIARHKDSVRFEDIAGKYSEDEETKNNGGLLINPNNGSSRFEMTELGQVDPTLSFTIDKLNVGDLSSPSIITTRDGKQAYRVLYLKSRSKPHVQNLTDDYQRIQNAALLEKQQRVIDEWINKKLLSTYVKIIWKNNNPCTFEHNWVATP